MAEDAASEGLVSRGAIVLGLLKEGEHPAFEALALLSLLSLLLGVLESCDVALRLLFVCLFALFLELSGFFVSLGFQLRS